MLQGIGRATTEGRPVEYRRLDGAAVLTSHLISTATATETSGAQRSKNRCAT
jgi:hypothetical protein